MRHRRACFFISPSGHAVTYQVPHLSSPSQSRGLYHFLPSPRRRPGAIAPQEHLYMHHYLDSGVKPRNDTYESVCGKNSVFLSSPRRRPGAIAPQGHLYMHHDLDSGVKPRNDTCKSVCGKKTLFFCRHPSAGRGPLPHRDIFICTMTWIPGSSPGMTKAVVCFLFYEHCSRFLFTDIVYVFVADVFVCVIPGLDPGIQVM